MDKTIQTEVVLNMINTLFAKANFYKDEETVSRLNECRRKIYYEEFNYDEIISLLKEIEIYLKKYE